MPEVSTGLSLAVIVAVLTITTIASIVAVRKDPDRVAHAGSVRGHQPSDDSDTLNDSGTTDDSLSSDEA